MVGGISAGRSCARRGKRKRRAGLSMVAEARLRGQLRREAPSEPWVDAQFRSVVDLDADGRAIVCYYHDPHVFPPGGKQTAMVRCPICGVFTPPNGFEKGACLDHAEHDHWGPSPSAVTIRALQFYNLRIEEADLPPEDERSLLREIASAKRRTREMRKRARARKSKPDKAPIRIV